jgi:hypothetical protein
VLNHAAFHAGYRRLRCPKQEGAGKPNSLQSLSEDAGLERTYIRGDVGQFGHAFIFSL